MKTTFLSFLFAVSSFIGFAQSDSVYVTSDFTDTLTVNPGLDSAAFLLPVLQVRVNAGILDSISIVTVLVYAEDSESPLAVGRYEQTALSAGTMVNDGVLFFHFGYLDPLVDYRIRTEVQNLNMAYIAAILTFEPAN